MTGPTVIGRQKSCGLAIEDRTVSREHARIFRDGLRYVVQDAGSRGGTFLNGKRLAGPETLSHGDVLRIGSFRIRFLLDETERDSATVLSEAPPPVATAPARIRPRGSGETTMLRRPGPVLAFAMYVFLLAVFGALTWASRLGFGWLLDRVLS